ncbi:MAG: pyruvate kinase [Oscillospiraceae bacterium]|nr:pyruvate kinase [Oscillospiraceae bacterium]
MRKTKIICTIGPATDSEEIMRKLMLAGMNVARFNFSHADPVIDKRRFDMIVRLREEVGLPVATMLDTKGPEIRLKTFKNNEPVIIEDGNEYTLTTRDIEGTDKICSITFKGLPKDVQTGSRILINDGVIELEVTSVTAEDINCKIIHGGKLSNHKGINVPGVALSLPYISEADMNDLEFGAKMGFDFIAASFVRSAADVNYLRKFTHSLGWNNVRIIAKIENADGVANIDEILEAADGIMVARGDMGVEIPFEQIPAIQKELISKGYTAGRQVITATQMLESMISSPRPTRAEITDVANAIYDGTSAIMLSGETAAGKYPVEAVETMARIAECTESNIDYTANLAARKNTRSCGVTEAISHATVTTAADLDAAAIITVTKSGKTARMISKYRPSCDIIGLTPDPVTCRQMNLSWGVRPALIGEMSNTDELIAKAKAVSKENGFVRENDTVVITAGVPLGISGNTNLLEVETIG